MSIAGETIAPMSIAGVAIEGKAHKSKSSKSKSQIVEIGEWTTYGALPWFITETLCGPGAPSDICFHAGISDDRKITSESKGEDDLAVDTDVEVGGQKKQKPGNLKVIEAIGDYEFTTLQNNFTFQRNGILTFDMFCSSEVIYDHCIVKVDGEIVIQDSGAEELQGSPWMKKSIIVSQGQSLIQWKYKKDSNRDEGYDTMKLDNINFFPVDNYIVVDNFDSKPLGPADSFDQVDDDDIVYTDDY